MTRRKKKAAEEALDLEEVSAPPSPKTVPCPVRGHKHDLALVPHPDRPDLVIARCGDRDVYQTRAKPTIRPVDPQMADFHYVIPRYEDEGE